MSATQLSVRLTPKLMDALEGTLFASECPEEMRMGCSYITSGYMWLETAEAHMLVDSIRQVMPNLHPSVRRAAEDRIALIGELIAARERLAAIRQEPEQIKEWGKVAVDLLRSDINERVAERVGEIEAWGEYDPDVRPVVRRVRDALAALQDAIDELPQS